MSNAARILLAEDDIVISTLIVELLADADYQVTACADEQEAWERLDQDAAYDLILLDRLMPRGDGIDVLRAIKADPRFEHIPVVMETALQDQASIRDQGDGFDWSNHLDFSPERAFDTHGRGIALARKLSFDSLEYLGNGNTVLASIHHAATGNAAGRSGASRRMRAMPPTSHSPRIRPER